jgi:hypothetical protein
LASPAPGPGPGGSGAAPPPPQQPLVLPGIDKKKKSVAVCVCDILHPKGSVYDVERVFCHTLIEHHIALTQQKLERARLLAQVRLAARHPRLLCACAVPWCCALISC